MRLIEDQLRLSITAGISLRKQASAVRITGSSGDEF
jgi:hypothetical protein